MMIGDYFPSKPTVQIPGWDLDPTAQRGYPLSPSLAGPGSSPDSVCDGAFSALQRYLPSNKDDVAAEEGGGEIDGDDFGIPVDAFSCDDFRMFEFKVKGCARAKSHDWTECPFVHHGEKARRRDPRRYKYSGSACPDFRKGACARGDACEYAHGVFECWLHPARYRTQICKDGTHCRRRVCFFAHSPDQLRILAVDSINPKSMPPSSYSPPDSPSGPVSLSQLSETVRILQLSRLRPAHRTGFFDVGFGSPRHSPLPAIPSPISPPPFQEESAVTERVESGRALREKLYAKLGEENSLNR
ncbi:hypothetical protein M569_01136, partial [Genlisea aurea]